MKNRNKKEATIESPTYMEMGLHTDGKESLILRIPTFWDEVEKQWIGAIQTPTSRKLITAHGKNSLELQNNFNVEISKLFHDKKYSDEIFSMFKPLEEWE